MQTPVTHRCLGPRHFLEMLTRRLCIIRVPVAHRFWTLWLTGGPGCRVIPAPDTRNATKPHSRSPKLARGGCRSLPTRKRPRGFVHRGPAGGGGGLALCASVRGDAAASEPACPALSGFLQLLSQPGRQRLPQPVQQLGQLHVVVPVVAGEEGSRLEGKSEKDVTGWLHGAARPASPKEARDGPAVCETGAPGLPPRLRQEAVREARAGPHATASHTIGDRVNCRALSVYARSGAARRDSG